MIIIKTNKSFSRLNLHADDTDTLTVAANLLFNINATNDTPSVKEGQTSIALRSNKRRFVRSLLSAKRAELHDVLGQSPKMARVCVEVAHFMRDAVEVVD